MFFPLIQKTTNRFLMLLSGLKLIFWDIDRLSDTMVGITYVYHCAAFVSFEPDKYQLLRKVNIEGTSNIVNLCLSHNIKKLCYVSSIATIGHSIDNSPITENTNWNPEADNSVYAITKYGAEMGGLACYTRRLKYSYS